MEYYPILFYQKFMYVNGLRYVFAPTTSIWKALNGEKLGRARKN